MYMYDNISPFLLRMRNVSDESYRKNKKYILCSITFFLKKSVIYDITLKYGGA